MPDDVATLADTVVSDKSDASTTADTAKTDTTAVADTSATENTEAAEIGNILLNSGWTKDKINDLIEAPGALAAMRYAVENNPKEFLNMLERANPEIGRKFLQDMADTFVERYEPAKKPVKADKSDVSNELMEEVKALREKTNRLETEQARRDAAAALASTQERYKARVEDLFGQLKDLNLTKSETKALRARLDSELSSDPTVVQRASKGNFVDVAPTFKRIVDEWGADKKAQAEAEKTGRDKQQKGALPDFQSGPNFTMDVPTATFDSWDATEDGFAKALASTGK